MKSFKINPVSTTSEEQDCIVGYNTQSFDSIVFTPHIEYEVKNVDVNPKIITLYPQQIQLTFNGITKKYNKIGEIIEEKTEQINIPLTIDSQQQLVGSYYWNGIPVNYTLEEEVGIASVLYTKELGGVSLSIM